MKRWHCDIPYGFVYGIETSYTQTITPLGVGHITMDSQIGCRCAKAISCSILFLDFLTPSFERGAATVSSVTPPQQLPGHQLLPRDTPSLPSTQPTGLPHHTPGLTGQHVLTVSSFTREQVGVLMYRCMSVAL